MFFVLSKILDVFLSPLTWGVLLVLSGLSGRAQSRTRPARMRAITGVVVLLSFSLEPVSNGLMRLLEPAPRPMPAAGSYDAVIVLGGMFDSWVSQDTGTRAYNGSIERLLVTYELVRRGVARDVVISAGRTDPHDRLIEAEVLRDQLVEFGVPPERIAFEGRSRNTRENADFTRTLVRARGYRRLLLVTSARHMPRSLDEFARVGVAVDPFPVDFRSHAFAGHELVLLPRAGFLADSTAALRELFGRLVYRLTR